MENPARDPTGERPLTDAEKQAWKDLSTPDPTWYDRWVIFSSGGKDSLATHDYVAERARAAGVQDRVVVAHCDLGEGAEWPGTTGLVRDHAAHYGHRFEVVRRIKDGKPQGLLAQIEWRGYFPSADSRYCTSDQKRGPGQTLFTRLAREIREDGLTERPVRILSIMGMRAQESPLRAAKLPFRHDSGPTCLCEACQALPREERGSGVSNGRKHIDEWLPLHSWQVEDVLARCKASGTLMHPAYALGLPRASCMFCVLASRSALVRAAQLDPATARRYAELEDRIGHTIQYGFSMWDAIARAEAAGDTPVLVKGWVG